MPISFTIQIFNVPCRLSGTSLMQFRVYKGRVMTSSLPTQNPKKPILMTATRVTMGRKERMGQENAWTAKIRLNNGKLIALSATG